MVIMREDWFQKVAMERLSEEVEKQFFKNPRWTQVISGSGIEGKLNQQFRIGDKVVIGYNSGASEKGFIFIDRNGIKKQFFIKNGKTDEETQANREKALELAIRFVKIGN